MPKRLVNLNEHLILRRDNVKFQISINDLGTFTGNGRIVLTSRRIVMINSNRNDDEENGDPFVAFELPLHKLEKE